MTVFPPGNPRLNVVEAAGTAIAESTNGVVLILLPANASTNQTVKVRARGFTNDIPITVAVTPENGSSARSGGLIPYTGNPSEAEVTVTLPRETINHIHVWTLWTR
jgi:hypothetical protein